jgi:hypothetical protein
MKKYTLLGSVAVATACVGILATCSSASGQVGFGQKDPVVATGKVGFNATRTEFTLPINLGLLPGPNLHLAKANPAYAASLANAQDWATVLVRYGQSTSDLKSGLFWTFVGSPNNPISGTYSPYHLYIEVRDGVPVSWTNSIV